MLLSATSSFWHHCSSLCVLRQTSASTRAAHQNIPAPIAPSDWVQKESFSFHSTRVEPSPFVSNHSTSTTAMGDRWAAGTNYGDLQSRRTKLVMRTTNSLKNVSSTFASQGPNGDEVCVAVVPKNHACCYQCCIEVSARNFALCSRNHCSRSLDFML